MELTSRTLRDVEFREKLRGYHPEDVDAFLEDAAAELDGLLARMRAAEAAQAARIGAPGAGSAAVVAPPPDPTQGLSEAMVSRALLLAQYTADRALAEAEEQARLVRAQARADAARMLEAAGTAAAGRTAGARREREIALGELERRRTTLQQEVESLRAWAARHRDELSGVLAEPAATTSGLPPVVAAAPPPHAAAMPSVSAPPPSGPVVDLTAAEPVVDLTAAEPPVDLVELERQAAVTEDTTA